MGEYTPLLAEEVRHPSGDPLVLAYVAKTIPGKAEPEEAETQQNPDDSSGEAEPEQELTMEQLLALLEELEPNSMSASSLWGTIGHEALDLQAKREAGLITDAEIEVKMNELYGNKPSRYLAASFYVQGAYERIKGTYVVPEGRTAMEIREFRLYPGKRSAAAFRTISLSIIEEQKRHGKADGPLAHVVRVNPVSLEPGQPDGRYKGALEAVSDEYLAEFGLTREAFDEHIKYLYPFYWAHRGDLLMMQASRPDSMIMEFDSSDEQAANASRAFAAAMQKNVGLDADKMVETLVPYGESEITALDAILKFADAIINRQVTVMLRDDKFLTHLGREFAGLDDVWKEFGGDLSQIFAEETLQRSGEKYGVLRSLWRSLRKDIVKTDTSLWGMFRVAAKKHESMHPDAPALDEQEINNLMLLVKNQLRLIDFDCRTADGLSHPDGSEDLVDFVTYPKMDTTNIPESDDITSAIKEVPKDKHRYERLFWQQTVYERHIKLGDKNERLITRKKKVGRAAIVSVITAKMNLTGSEAVRYLRLRMTSSGDLS